MKRKPGLTRPMALLLSLSMAAGVLPTPALAAQADQPAAVQAATPEQAAPAAAAPETPTEQETAETAATPAPVQEPAAPQALALQPQTAETQQQTAPQEGDTITIDGVQYEVTGLPAENASGELTLTDGTAYSGALVLADGVEYAGGRYNVTELADGAFSGNTALTSVDMTDSSVKSIGRNCFRDCTALTSVQFAADTVTNMQKAGVFSGCTSLTRLSIPAVNLSSRYNNSPFAGSSIQELTIYNVSGTGIQANLLNNMPDGFTLNLPGDISSTALAAATFGSTKNVTLNLGVQEDVEHYAAVFDGRDVKVQLLGGEEGALATVTDSTGAMTGYATLNDAIAAINESEDAGPFQIRTASSGSTLIEWAGDVAPNKATVINFAGASVDLPDTLTLQAPLTIENITNINPDEDTLTTLVAGDYAFAMVDGGSFGFAEIRGSDLTFDEQLPGGSFGGGRQVQLTGVGDGATVTFANVGRSDYYYDLPNLSGFETVVLDGAYLEADGGEAFQGQLDDAAEVVLQDGGLTVNRAAEIETLSGSGELRIADGAALKVTGSAFGSFRLAGFEGTELTGSGLSLPADSEVSLTNANGEPVAIPEPAVRVEGLGEYVSMADAFAAIAAGAADSYTVMLLDDVALEANAVSGAYDVVELPAKALTIQGGGHTLAAGDSRTRNYVYAAADLTLDNVELNMPKTYLRITGEGAAVTVEGTVTGTLEKIDASVSTGCTVRVKASVSDDVIDGIAGTSKNKMTVILQGYGSLEAPAGRTAFPAVSNSSGALVLENSWLVADNAASWGAIEVRQGGGLSLTGSMPNASVKGWQVAEGVTADLTVKSGRLTINGQVSGRTQIHFSGSQMAAEGAVLVKAAKGALDSFVLAQPLEGLALLPDADGNYTLMPVTVENPVVTLSGGSFGSGIQFASWQEAAAALEKADGSAETCTVTLNADLTLPAATALPDVALVFDGGGHTLALAEGDTLSVRNSLTLQNVALDMGGATLKYIRSGSGEKAITFAETASGSVGSIADVSGSRWLDIVFMSDGVSFGKVTGTTSSIGTRLTDLILTGFGSREEPVDLAGKVENIAGLELNGSWVAASGDATYLGTIRTDSDRTGGLVLTGDATVSRLSVTTNDAFEVWVPADATLTVEERYSHSNQQVPVYADGQLTDGHALVAAPRNSNRNMTDYLLVNAPEGVELYWDADTLTYRVNCPPMVAMSADAEQYGDAYTKVLLDLSDAQGIASVTVNGRQDAAWQPGETAGVYAPDVSLLVQGDNAVTVTDAAGKSTTFAFRYDAPADYSKVEEALARVPADLTGYTPESVRALQQAVDAVQYGFGRSGQEKVDAMAQAILDAIAALEPVEPGTDPNQPTDPDQPGGGSEQTQQPAATPGSEHPEIAEAIANGTWGQPQSTPAPTAAPGTQAVTPAVPQTADAADLALWAVLAALSLGGLAGLVLLRRRGR